MNTYMLMVIGLVMMVMGCLFWVVRSINKGRTGDVPVFFGGAMLSIVMLLFLLVADNNPFTNNTPLVIVIRIMVFILGLSITFSVLFRFSSVMDKVQVLLDKVGLYRTTRMNNAVSLIFLIILGVFTIIIIKLI